MKTEVQLATQQAAVSVPLRSLKWFIHTGVSADFCALAALLPVRISSNSSPHRTPLGHYKLIVNILRSRALLHHRSSQTGMSSFLEIIVVMTWPQGLAALSIPR
jgi:hypothetical protein